MPSQVVTRQLPSDLWPRDHADGADVTIGDAEQGHDDGVGHVRLEEDRRHAPVPRPHVAEQEEGDEDEPGRQESGRVRMISCGRSQEGPG